MAQSPFYKIIDNILIKLLYFSYLASKTKYFLFLLSNCCSFLYFCSDSCSSLQCHSAQLVDFFSLFICIDIFKMSSSITHLYSIYMLTMPQFLYLVLTYFMNSNFYTPIFFLFSFFFHEYKLHEGNGLCFVY